MISSQQALVNPNTVRLRKMAGGSLRWNLAEWFVLSQTFLPALLFLPGSQSFRVPIRVASYGISLGLLAYFWIVIRLKNRDVVPRHPAVPLLSCAMIYLFTLLVHPTTNSVIAGAAQIALYISVFAPVIWAPSFVETPARLKRLLWLMLLCNGINAFVGVMQVHDPDRWMPKEFSSVITASEYGLGTVTYEGANGSTIIRPPGLGDSPGAVCGPAVFALFLGLVFVTTAKAWWQKAVAGAFAILGAAAIFLTLVRSSFLIAVGIIVVYFIVLILQRRLPQAGALVTVTLIAMSIAFIHSASVGGDSLTSRFHTIVEEDPVDFYYENRGNQVVGGFTDLLPRYPFGAGLGRWGMMNAYFGNPSNAAAFPIWVETQIPGWMIDGGIFLLILYPLALLIALHQEIKLALARTSPAIRTLAGIVFAANAGLLAHCSSYPVFASPVGMQFWFLAGALHGVASSAPRSKRTRRVNSAPPLPNVTDSRQPLPLPAASV